MDSISGDGNYTTPARSPGVSPPRMMIVRGESGELSPPVLSITFPAIQEKIRSALTDSISSESGCSSDEFVSGGASDGCGSGGNADKKPVWSKPVNAVGVMGELMGDACWPSLGDSTTKKDASAIAKSSSSESLQSREGSLLQPAIKVAGNSSPNHITPSVQNSMLEISGNSVSEESPASQVPKVESPLTTSAEPVTESLQSLSDGLLQPALQVTGNASSSSSSPKLPCMNTKLTTNHVTHSVQNSTNQISGNSVSEESPTSQDLKDESPLTTCAKLAATFSDSYPKGPKHKESPRGGVGTQPNSGNGHHRQQNSYRRPNGRLHPRADGFYYHNYGGNPGQGKGYRNQAWNHNTNFNNRVTSMPPQRGGYYRHSYIQHLAPFFHSTIHLPVRPSSYNFQYHAPPEHPLHEKITKQIDYYFSSDNLAKDVYLRRHMDEQGWVSVDLIAGFNKVSSLTKNVKLILDVMQKSNVVEVQGGKMRRRNDWMKWPIPTAVQNSMESQLQGIQLQQGGGHQPLMA